MKPLFAVLLWALALPLFAQQADYTVIVLPDTQYYSSKYPATFKTQTQWIKDHRTSFNIQLVIGVGDIVDGGGSTTQWINADAAVDTLDASGIPYVFAIGNHDYNSGDKAPLKRSVSNFNKYFGPTRYTGKGYYRSNFKGSNENFYATVSLGGQETLVILLEFNPRPGAVAWAKKIIEANAGLPAIVVTHSYGYANGRVSTCDSTASEAYGLNEDLDGEDLWEQFVSKYENVYLVLSGHIVASSGVGRRQDFGESGNLVSQVLSDYQAYANGGNGWLRIMRFKPSLNRVDVETFSPTLNAKLTDANNQFSLPLQGTSSGTASLSGRITDNTACTALSGVKVSDGVMSTLTDVSGNYTLNGIAPGDLAITASKSGFFSKTRAIHLEAGRNGTLKLSLTVQ